jgi:hypothetical protein
MSDQQHLENAVRKRPTAKQIGWGLCAVAVLGFYWLSASHFCFRKMRYLTDEDYVLAAIDHVRPYVQTFESTASGIQRELQGRNPKCCYVVRTNEHFDPFARLTNEASVRVMLYFPLKEKYRIPLDQGAYAAAFVSSCGKAYAAYFYDASKSISIYPEHTK